MSKNLQSAAYCASAAASGTAALSFELIWIRQIGNVTGTTAYAVALVLAVFFAGLGAGAWLFGRWADRLRRPLVLFALLEAAIALYVEPFRLGLRAMESLSAHLAPAEWSLAHSLAWKGTGAAVLLAVPTLAMGGTLPVLARHAIRARERIAPSLGLLYGWNTIGGAAGVFLVVFVLIPRLGLHAAMYAAALGNAAAIALALLAGARKPAAAPRRREPAPVPAAPGRRDVLYLAVAAWAGFASIGLEVAWTRALTMRFTSTVYSFATILLVYLASMGAGAALVKRITGGAPPGRRLLVLTLGAAGLAALLSLGILGLLPPVDLRSPRALAGGLQLRELAAAVAVLAVPTACFGTLFPLLSAFLDPRRGGIGTSVGRLYLANTGGAVAGPLATGLVLLPALGLAASVLVLAGLTLGLALLLHATSTARAPLPRPALAALAAAALLAAFGPGSAALWRESPGERLLHYRDGVAASVAVVERPGGELVLKIDHTYHLGASHRAFAQSRQGLIPLVLAPSIEEGFLFIGLATGGSAGPVAAAGVPRVDVVEILPGLREVLPYFAAENHDLARAIDEDGRVRLLEVDGRQLVRATDETYGAVVGDLYLPWRAGEGAMYTLEHFEAVRRVLSPSGLFCQWLPLYQLRPEDLRTIVATACEAFPHVEAIWLYFNAEQPAIGLLCSVEPLAIGVDHVAGRLERNAAILERAGLLDWRPLLGSWIAGRERLVAWSEGAPIETEDRPRIEFEAPLRLGRRDPAPENAALMLELAEPVDGAPFALADEERAAVERHRRAIGHMMRAEIAIVHEGVLERAARELERAVEATPQWSLIAWKLETVVERGLERGDLSAALRAAEALATSPRYEFHGLYYAALVRERAGERGEARALAEAACALRPEHSGVQSLLDELERP